MLKGGRRDRSGRGLIRWLNNALPDGRASRSSSQIHANPCLSLYNAFLYSCAPSLLYLIHTKYHLA